MHENSNFKLRHQTTTRVNTPNSHSEWHKVQNLQHQQWYILMETPTAPSIAQIADQCFDDLAAHIENQGQVTVEQMSKLGLLLGRNWQKALQVVDQNEVECFQGETSGRRIFQVRGKSGVYLTFARSYCCCQAYYYEVVSKTEALYCKHQLAARLAYALKRCPVTVVLDTAIAQFLLDS